MEYDRKLKHSIVDNAFGSFGESKERKEKKTKEIPPGRRKKIRYLVESERLHKIKTYNNKQYKKNNLTVHQGQAFFIDFYKKINISRPQKK